MIASTPLEIQLTANAINTLHVCMFCSECKDSCVFPGTSKGEARCEYVISDGILVSI